MEGTVIESGNISGASFTLSADLDDSYSVYEIIIYQFAVSTDDTQITATIDVGGSELTDPEYNGIAYWAAGVDGATAQEGATSLALTRTGATNGVGNTAGYVGHLKILLTNPAGTGNRPNYHIEGFYVAASGTPYTISNKGFTANDEALTNINLIASAGTMSGKYIVQGIL